MGSGLGAESPRIYLSCTLTPRVLFLFALTSSLLDLLFSLWIFSLSPHAISLASYSSQSKNHYLNDGERAIFERVSFVFNILVWNTECRLLKLACQGMSTFSPIFLALEKNGVRVWGWKPQNKFVMYSNPRVSGIFPFSLHNPLAPMKSGSSPKGAMFGEKYLPNGEVYRLLNSVTNFLQNLLVFVIPMISALLYCYNNIYISSVLLLALLYF